MGTMFSEIAFAPSDPQTVYAGSRNTSIALELVQPTGLRGLGIARSTDGGQTWATANLGLGHLGVSTLAFGPDGTLFAGTNCASVWRLRP